MADRINLVRFAGDRLVTADLDNRVVFWPRHGSRIVDQVVNRGRARR